MTKVTLCDLGLEEYKQIMDVWRAAGLSIRPEGRDAPEAFARQLAQGSQRVVGVRAVAAGSVSNEQLGAVPAGTSPVAGSDLLVAVAVLTHDGRKGWINRLAVRPAYRRHGLAGMLIAEAERWFRDDVGLEVFAALIESENDASQALFRSAGYTPLDVVYVTKRLRPNA